ncbi:aureusidin synthase-like [Tripterygium wilfordii]|uniref:Aureusidin synthase-like n=1 Tax=Tripterygium wilfordii TaxID=458696 RepID=A0A7J7BZ93_TRIWF|nr:aureusidin synthase-like [Tripterygium wilfordii]KAF5727203.1 aureusidin synthase-like [Tripterygium wilfordii]
MERKRLVPAIKIFIFSLLAFTLTLCVLESDQLHYAPAILREFKNIILSILGERTLSPHNLEKTWVLSPNLSTCHQSLGRVGLHVYCCPPKPESEEPVIDFQFPDPSSPLRTRRPAHRLDDNYISKYKKALDIMKSLPYDDPRSFMRQADMHCLYCTGAYNQQHTNYPLNIHRSWLFFPWHRMMMYFHERILGSLIGDDTFALPFWAWDIPDGMMTPEMYLNEPFTNHRRDTSHYSKVVDLNYGCEKYSCSERGLSSQEQIDYNLALMYNHVVSGAKKMELFMGCPLKAGESGFCDGKGTIETAPHNTVHKWIGSGTFPGREDMGVFYSAARDPSFYAHHTNIDRLWEVWRGLHDNVNMTDPDWLNTAFYFHNEKSQLVRIRIRDVLDITKLRYAYEEVELVWLDRRPKPSVPPKVAHHILNMRERENGLQLPSNHNLSGDFSPRARTLDRSIIMNVQRPWQWRARGKGEEEVLIVYGIDVKEDVHVKFDVYVNVVDESIMSPFYREFAGTFVHMPRGVDMVSKDDDIVRRKRKATLKLGISELLEDLEADRDEFIWVTLFPRTRSCINTTIDGMLIDYIQ